VSTPGLQWRRLRAKKVAYWVCLPSIARKGYPLRTQRLWSGIEPTDEDMRKIEEACEKLQYEMHDWSWSPKASRYMRHHKTPTFIYFLRCGGHIKIGVAKNVDARIGQLQMGCPLPLELIAAVPGKPMEEKKLHAKFRHLRSTGEWFRAEKPLLDFIAERTAMGTKRHPFDEYPLLAANGTSNDIRNPSVGSMG
jgi:Meiotically Up-regulated Gene 113 (MUG113) protein